MNPNSLRLTRVAFCPSCFAKGLPKPGIRFVTIGRNRQQYVIRSSKRSGQRGFTPHMVQRKFSENGYVTFYSTCAMEGCGVKFIPIKDKPGKLFVEAIHEEEKMLPIREWNYMVSYTEDPQYWLD